MLFIIVLVAFPPLSGADILINEFMGDPARDWDGDGEYNYRDDEWLEIVNTGSLSVDLGGYFISDGEGYPVWRYGFSGVLSAGQVLVIYGSDSRAWEEASGMPVYGLSMNNAGDRLSIYRVEGVDTVLVDSCQYGNLAAEDDRSLGRSVDSPETWEIFDAYNPCTDSCDPSGNGCIPTPGQVNSCTTSAADVSWGRIKNTYLR